MNLPNKLSIARVCMIPVLVVLMMLPGWGWSLAAAAVFALASFTDYLDGHIARSRGLVTDFGKFIDPVADKLLTLSAMIMLSQRGAMPAWAVVLVLARELCVDGLRLVAVTQGKVIAAAKLGKIKTCSQIWMILWMLVHVSYPAFSGGVCGWISTLSLAWTLIITLWSGVEYFRKNPGVLRNA